MRTRFRVYAAVASLIVAVVIVVLVLASAGGGGQVLAEAEAVTAAQQQFIANDKSGPLNFGFASVNEGTLQTHCLASQDSQTAPGWCAAPSASGWVTPGRRQPSSSLSNGPTGKSCRKTRAAVTASATWARAA
jgi:hypothetical protein